MEVAVNETYMYDWFIRFSSQKLD